MKWDKTKKYNIINEEYQRKSRYVENVQEVNERKKKKKKLNHWWITSEVALSRYCILQFGCRKIVWKSQWMATLASPFLSVSVFSVCSSTETRNALGPFERISSWLNDSASQATGAQWAIAFIRPGNGDRKERTYPRRGKCQKTTANGKVAERWRRMRNELIKRLLHFARRNVPRCHTEKRAVNDHE